MNATLNLRALLFAGSFCLVTGAGAFGLFEDHTEPQANSIQIGEIAQWLEQHPESLNDINTVLADNKVMVSEYQHLADIYR